MLKRTTFALSLAALVAFAGSARAQRPGIRPIPGTPLFQLTPYVGYMIFDNFFTGPVGSTLSTRSNAVYGAQLGMYIAPHVALVGNVAYSSTDLQVGVPFFGGVNAGNTNVWLYDGDLQVDIPTGVFSPVRPFLQIGAGAMHYDIDAINILHTSATNFAANAGVGLDYQFTPAVGLRLMVKDYIGKFNFQQATSFNIQGRTTQNWALTAGLEVGF